MADTIKLTTGSSPWQPGSDVDLLEAWDEYDVPLCGWLRQDGADFLFVNLWGGDREASVWAYAPLTAGELDILRDASGRDFDDAVESVLTAGNLVVAFAREKSGVLVTAVLGASFKSRLDVLVAAAEAVTAELESWIRYAQRPGHLASA